MINASINSSKNNELKKEDSDLCFVKNDLHKSCLRRIFFDKFCPRRSHFTKILPAALLFLQIFCPWAISFQCLF